MAAITTDQPIEAILFDLDGTLLRVQMEQFIPRYVEGLATFCAPSVKPKKFIRVMLTAIRELITVAGDGSASIEERLLLVLRRELGLSVELFSQSLDHYALHHLEQLRGLVQPIPLAHQIIRECHRRGIPMVLATNPVFPRFMIDARMAWGGLEQHLFRHVTSYENCRYCKPQAGYFQDIADLLDIPAHRCLMVGNDSSHDLAAAAIGMRTFLVDTWLVERSEQRWPSDYRGDHSRLQQFLQQL